ncbi:MAG TPA: hypothetical protein VNN12_00045, partial [Dehalococcoidia bacterium]|nr:hypothetical protein [Dehalococcoidia bacterium]
MLAHAIVLIATVTSASLLFVFLDISWLPGLEVSYFVFAWIIGRWRCDLCGDLARLQDAITFDPESGWR